MQIKFLDFTILINCIQGTVREWYHSLISKMCYKVLQTWLWREISGKTLILQLCHPRSSMTQLVNCSYSNKTWKKITMDSSVCQLNECNNECAWNTIMSLSHEFNFDGNFRAARKKKVAIAKLLGNENFSFLIKRLEWNRSITMLFITWFHFLGCPVDC